MPLYFTAANRSFYRDTFSRRCSKDLRIAFPQIAAVLFKRTACSLTKTCSNCASAPIPLFLSLIDGPADVNDAFRIAFNGEGTYERAVAGIDRIRNIRRPVGIFTAPSAL